jgi:uncharacterized protein (DUF1778 family)
MNEKSVKWQVYDISEDIDKLVTDAAKEKGIKKNQFIILVAGDAAREILKSKKEDS